MQEAIDILILIAGSAPEVVAAIKNLLQSTQGMTLQQIIALNDTTYNAILLNSKS